MTTPQNELIRYPVAASAIQDATVIKDADGKHLCDCVDSGRTIAEDQAIAAEIVRVLNACHAFEQEHTPSDKEFNGWLIDINELLTGKHCNSPWEVSQHRRKELIMELQEKAKAVEQSSQPAPVAASGEPSDAAMEAAEIYCNCKGDCGNPCCEDRRLRLARIIEDVLVAERAEGERRASVWELKAQQLADTADKAERERNEARAECEKAKTRGDDHLTAWEHKRDRVMELEKELAKVERQCKFNHDCWNNAGDNVAKEKKRAQAAELKVSRLETKIQIQDDEAMEYAERCDKLNATIAQLRADLDEAVGLLRAIKNAFGEYARENIDSRYCYSISGVTLKRAFSFLDRLSKPSEPGNCSGGPNSSQAKPVRYEDIEGPVRYTVSGDHVEYTPNPPEPATESGDGEVPYCIAKNDTIATLRQKLAERDEKINLIQVSWKHDEEQFSTQLAERDAEIARLNSVLAGVEKLIHSSSTEKVV